MLKHIALGCGGLLAAALVAGSLAASVAVHAVHAAAPQTSQSGIGLLESFVTGGKTHVEALPRAVLATVLPPSVGAFVRVHAASSAASVSGVSGTSASATYRGDGDGHVDIEVTDAANMSGLTTSMTLAMATVTSENDEGYERNAELGAVRVHETWVAAGRRATLLGLAGDRFVVTVSSEGIGMPATERAFRAVDLAKLPSR